MQILKLVGHSPPASSGKLSATPPLGWRSSGPWTPPAQVCDCQGHPAPTPPLGVQAWKVFLATEDSAKNSERSRPPSHKAAKCYKRSLIVHTRPTLQLIYRTAKLKLFWGLPSLMKHGVIYWTLSELRRSGIQVRESQVLQRPV